MLVANGGQPVVIVTDWQSRVDRELDMSERRHAPHVLHLWRLGREALGRNYYRTTRIALFGHGTTPDRREVARARAALRDYVSVATPAHLFVIPTPDAQAGEGASAVAGTVCWGALGAPDALGAMRLAWWRRGATTVVPLYPIARRAKELQMYATAKALQGATGQMLEPASVTVEVGLPMVATLRHMTGLPLAVDLEFIPGRDTVTAINLSDGVRAVSLPFHAYVPRGHEESEPALDSYTYGDDVREVVTKLLAAPTPKYCHNFVADVPLLYKLGFSVGGEVLDTFAAHAIAFPELPHGLQMAAASVANVPPWKSLYRPKDTHGLNKDDADYWTADPLALRDYGAKDAFYTWHLAQAVMPWVGVNAVTGKKA